MIDYFSGGAWDDITGFAKYARFDSTYEWVQCPERFFTGDKRPKIRFSYDTDKYHYSLQPINFRKQVVKIEYNGKPLRIGEWFAPYDLVETYGLWFKGNHYKNNSTGQLTYPATFKITTIDNVSVYVKLTQKLQDKIDRKRKIEIEVPTTNN